MSRSRLLTPLTACAALATAMIITVGCSPLAPPSAGSPSPTAASVSGAPAPAALDELDLSAEVYRTRSDPARGGIQLVVHNEGATTLTVVSAQLSSPALTQPVVRERRTVIAPGQSRDLALILGGAACPAEPLAPRAVLGIVLDDGTVVEHELPTTDRLGQWTSWVEQECFSAAVRERVTLTLTRAPTLDGPGTIGVVVRLDGRARADDVTVTGVRGTVLLSLIAEEHDAVLDTGVTPGDPVAQRTLDVSVGEGRSASIPLVMAPTRCDLHALADDKQGTLLPVDIELATERGATSSARSGVVIVAADATTKAELYAAIVRACEL